MMIEKVLTDTDLSVNGWLILPKNKMKKYKTNRISIAYGVRSASMGYGEHDASFDVSMLCTDCKEVITMIKDLESWLLSFSAE